MAQQVWATTGFGMAHSTANVQMAKKLLQYGIFTGAYAAEIEQDMSVHRMVFVLMQ